MDIKEYRSELLYEFFYMMDENRRNPHFLIMSL